MSRSVDERVVEMQFDNKQFESGIKTSMKSLENLKKGLNFDAATKSLSNIEKATRNFSVAGIEKGVDLISSKFTNLGIVGVTALQRITNEAITAGTQLIKSLTLDPVMQGFQEYELQMGSIQTILANTQSKGSTLNDVNTALAELNAYADQTIYNFAEMTRNIGTFTAAGVDLDTSVASIKGLANLAAVSGSSSAQAATAMYQLSQAIAAGKVQLMDWNSVVNAGMGGEVFQEALKRTARNLGYNVDAMIEKYGSFRESLTQGEWLTTEVLTETLKQLSGAYTEADLIAQGYTEDQAQAIAELANTATSAATEVKTFSGLIDTLREAVGSGWAQTWQLVFGDFEQAKELFTGISNVLSGMVNDASDARNALLREGLSSGWDQLLAEGISNEQQFIENVKAVANEHGIAIDEMISQAGSFEDTLKDGWLNSDLLAESIERAANETSGLSKEQLKNLGYTEDQARALQELNENVKNGSVNLEDFANKMTMVSGRENLIEGFKNIFDGIMSVLSPIGQAFREAFSFDGTDLYALTEGFRNLTENFKINETTSENIRKTFKALFDVLAFGVDIVTSVVGAFGKIVGAVLPAGDGIFGLTGTIGSMISWIVDAVESLDIFGTAIDTVTTPIEFLVGMIAEAGKSIGEFISFLNSKIDIPSFDTIKEAVETLREFQGSADDTLKVLKADVFGGFNPIIEMFGKFADAVGAAKDKIVEFTGMIKEAVAPISEQIKSVFEGVTFDDLLGAGGLVGIAVLIRKAFKRIDEAASNFDKVIDGVVDVLDTARESLEVWQKDIQAGTLLKIAAAVGILAGSLIALTFVDPDKLKDGLFGVTVLLAEVVATMEILSHFQVSGIAGAAASMVIMSIAISVLAGALSKLKDFQSWDETWPGIVAVGTLLTGLTASAKVLGKGVNGAELIKSSIGLVIFAEAVKRLAESMASFASLDSGSIVKSLGSLAAILAGITIFIRTSKLEQLKGARLTIIEIASSMIVLYAAIELLGRMDINRLIQGLATVGLLLGALSLSLRSIGSIKMSGVATSLLAMATAMNLLIVPIFALGSMNLGTLAKGLSSISVALLAMVSTLGILSKVSTGGASLIAISSSLLILSAALTAIIVPIGIMGSMPWQVLAAGLGAMVVVLAALGATSYALAPLGAALFTVAGALALFGVAAVGVGAGIMALSVGLATLAVSGAAGIGVLMGLLTGVLALIPVFAKELALGIVVFAEEIGNMAPVLGEALTDVILAALDSARNVIPAVSDTLLYLLSTILDDLVEYAPQIAQSLIDLFIAALDIVEDNVPVIIEKVASVLEAIAETIGGMVGEISPEDMQKLISVIGGLIVAYRMLSLGGGSIKGALKSAVGMAGVMTILSGMLAIISLLPIDETLDISASLSLLMLSISTTMMITSKIPIAGALNGIAGLGVFVAGLTAILAALGGLNQIPGFSWLIGEGSNVLGQIGTAIGSFIGGIIGSAISGVTSSFPQIGQDLSDFMMNAAPFFEGLQNVDASSMEGVQSLAASILVLTAADVINGLTSWFTGGSSLVDFGKQIADFAPYFRTYADTMKGIDPEVVTASATAAKALAEFASSIPNSGGVASFFAGENSLSDFAKELVEFGPNFAKYARSVSGIDASVVTASASAAKAMSELASNLPNSGGLVSFFTGDNDMGTFGEQLKKFGPAIKAYADSVSGIDPNVVTASATAAKALATLAESLPNSGGLISAFTGDNTLEGFGASLRSLGYALSEYYANISGVSVETINGTTASLRSLISLFNSMGSTNNGEISEFLNTINQIPSRMSKASDSVSRSLQSMSDSISSHSSNISSAFSNVITYGVNAVIAKSAELNSAGRTIITSFVNTINSSINGSIISAQASVSRLFEAMIYAAQQVLTNSQSKIQNEGKELIQSFIDGMNSKKSSAQSASQSIASAAESGMSGYTDDFYSVGSDMIQGLINGINSKRSAAINAAANVASSALQAAKNELDINSPSGEFEYLGEMSGEGYIRALTSMATRVSSASESVAESAISGARITLDKLPSILSSDGNLAPRITPVLDLSNVQSGAAMLNGMMPSGYSIQANVRARDISSVSRSIMDRNNPKPGRDYGPDILDAFTQLGARVDALGDRIAQMKMVLDSGAAVGGMSQKMDQRLGQMANYKGRNI